MIGDAFGIIRPFQVAFVFFLISSVYVRAAMPYISAASMHDGKKPAKGGVSAFLAPLKVLAPQVLRLKSGATRKHYGVFFLCCGVFLGVVCTGFPPLHLSFLSLFLLLPADSVTDKLATSYVPILIQQYATAAFDFSQADNGWLMSGYAFMRSIFLIFLFPRIISRGRRWFAAREHTRQHHAALKSQPAEDGLDEAIPTHPEEFGAGVASQAEGEPVDPPHLRDRDEDCRFDLSFLRWSLLVDGALTTGAAFATRGWHVYAAAFLLPFGSGSAPAAKGVITEMCPSSQRADALNAITLVENVARLATQGLFGFVFSALAETGRSYLTFFCNAAVAVVAMGVLLLSRFPPGESELVDEMEGVEVGEEIDE